MLRNRTEEKQRIILGGNDVNEIHKYLVTFQQLNVQGFFSQFFLLVMYSAVETKVLPSLGFLLIKLCWNFLFKLAVRAVRKLQ